MAADDKSGSALPADMLDVTWEWIGFLTSIEQVNGDALKRYTIRFDDNGGIALRLDCNHGSASYSLRDDRQITLGLGVVTQAACPSDALSDRFQQEIGRVVGYTLRDGELLLVLPAHSGAPRALRFRRQAEAPKR